MTSIIHKSHQNICGNERECSIIEDREIYWPEFWNSQDVSASLEGERRYDKRICRSEGADEGNATSRSVCRTRYCNLCRTSSSHFCGSLHGDYKNQRIWCTKGHWANLFSSYLWPICNQPGKIQTMESENTNNFSIISST